MQSENNVLIIGAGPSGLSAAKYALENGLIPLVLERQSEIGGVWSQSTGVTWHSMTTNLSKYSCSFTDLPWDQNADIFPGTADVHQYFIRYADKFNLHKYIKLNCKVIWVDFQDQDAEPKKYKIKYQNQNGEVIEVIANNLIIANGMFDRPFFPQISGLKDFQGEVIHSHDYKSAERFKGKKVIVIGGSFTGPQISSNICQYSSKTYHSFRKPFFVVKRFMKTDTQHAQPVDFVIMKWRNIYIKSGDTDIQARINNNRGLLGLCQTQQDLEALKITEQNMKLPLFLAISNDYEKQVRQGKISAKRGSIKKFKEHSIVFEDGSQEQIDSVILATGYLTNLDFLSPQIKSKIEYNEKDQRQPFILFQQMIHPDIHNMVFVGVVKASQIKLCQIHAKFAISLLAKKMKLPPRQKMIEDLKCEYAYRELEFQPQSPHANFVEHAYKLAKLMDPKFDFDTLKQQKPQLYKQMIMQPTIQQPHSWTFNKLEQQIKHINQLIQKTRITLD